MFFTQQGQCYWLKVQEVPQAARAARGKPMVSCIAIKPDERIAALVPVRALSDDQYLLFATKNGVVKKTVLSEDRKSTRLNSSHSQISYAVFCLKKKKNIYVA